MLLGWAGLGWVLLCCVVAGGKIGSEGRSGGMDGRVDGWIGWMDGWTEAGAVIP